MKFSDPFKILLPNERWAPTQSQMDAFQNAYEKLLPPLVYKIRLAVAKWREDKYRGASETTISLLNFWFNQEHLTGQTRFSFFFSQREAIESIVYLYEGEGGINFKIENQAQDGNIREYFPDFFVKTGTHTFYILETKGREDLDDLLKIRRLVTWCNDINNAQSDDEENRYAYSPVYVKQENWDDLKKDLRSFVELLSIFGIVKAIQNEDQTN